MANKQNFCSKLIPFQKSITTIELGLRSHLTNQKSTVAYFLELEENQ